MRNEVVLVLWIFMGLPGCLLASEVEVRTAGARSLVAVRPWTGLRDDGVVRQRQDYSCGAAALATLLSHYYGEPTTERDVLLRQTKPRSATFTTLADLASSFGYEARGYALSLDALAQLSLPVILYVEVKGNRHFSVLRRVGKNAVSLADPSLGNRIVLIPDFLKIWATRSAEAQEGRVLVVLPRRSSRNADTTFMREIPARFAGYNFWAAR